MPDSTAGSNALSRNECKQRDWVLRNRSSSFTAQNLHQIPSSLAIERNGSMATLYHRRRGGSLVRSFSLFVTDWFDSRTVARYQPAFDLPEIRSGGIPKIHTAVELSGQCDLTSNPIERISRSSKIEHQRGHANLEYASEMFYAYRCTWRRINVVMKMRNCDTVKSFSPLL